ncbi:putative protein-lysine deacylase ABHD14B [Antedon mediterranea]|uniref:putative protein-lysine deacylase ABHD14B n=1 Tax=Antedon mediterranea TaxID=105859 RepID=UPI003AF88838
MLMGVQVNKTAILLLIAAVLTLLFIYYPSVSSDKQSELSRVNAVENFAKEALEDKLRVFGGANEEGKLMNMTWEDIKDSALHNTKLTLTEEKFELKGFGQVYRRECVDSERESSGTILLLHGAKFNSETWKNLGTLHVMASYGYRVVAIDLPGGRGETPAGNVPDKADFLINVMSTLKIENPILISPSMSGGWSLPLIMKRSDLLKGYLPVAPVDTDKYKDDEYKTNQIQALVVYGDKDTALGSHSALKLTLLPNGQVHKLKDANHAAYLDQPLEFHRLLHNFADKLFGN